MHNLIPATLPTPPPRPAPSGRGAKAGGRVRAGKATGTDTATQNQRQSPSRKNDRHGHSLKLPFQFKSTAPVADHPATATRSRAKQGADCGQSATHRLQRQTLKPSKPEAMPENPTNLNSSTSKAMPENPATQKKQGSTPSRRAAYRRTLSARRVVDAHRVRHQNKTSFAGGCPAGIVPRCALARKIPSRNNDRMPLTQSARAVLYYDCTVGVTVPRQLDGRASWSNRATRWRTFQEVGSCQ